MLQRNGWTIRVERVPMLPNIVDALADRAVIVISDDLLDLSFQGAVGNSRLAMALRPLAEP